MNHIFIRTHLSMFIPVNSDTYMLTLTLTPPPPPPVDYLEYQNMRPAPLSCTTTVLGSASVNILVGVRVCGCEYVGMWVCTCVRVCVEV